MHLLVPANWDRELISPLSRSKADIVFTKAKVVVFVDGCFWHCCPKHGTLPKKNARWWRTKLAANVERDRKLDRQLRSAGWAVIRVWEHEDTARAAARVIRRLDRHNSDAKSNG